MIDENKIIEDNFFIIDSENLDKVNEKLYGFSIADGLIINDDNKKGKILEYDGAYVNVDINKDTIIISQDFMGSYGLYFFKSKDGYFAVSNSFVLLVKHLTDKYHLTFNKEYSDAYLFAGLCSIFYNETLVKEIKVLPRNSKVIIDKNNKRINFEEIDFEEHSIPINSKEAIEVLDSWYNKWIKIIRSLTKNTNNIYFELSGGFDSRVVASLWLTADIDLNNLRIYSSEKEIAFEDYEIVSQIAEKFNFKLNNPLSIPQKYFDDESLVIDLSFYSKMGFHNDMYFRNKYFTQPVFSFNGGGGETVRRLFNKSPSEYIESISYTVHNMDSSLKKSTEKILKRSLEEIKKDFKFDDDDAEEIVERLYKETRARYHYGKWKIEYFIGNNYSFSPLLDPLLHKIQLSTDEYDDDYLLMALILTRYCPELINFKIEGKRKFNEKTLEYARCLNEKYPFENKNRSFLKIDVSHNKENNENNGVTVLQTTENLSRIVLSKKFEKDFTKYYSKHAYDNIVETYYNPFNNHIYPILTSLSIIIIGYYLNTKRDTKCSEIIMDYMKDYTRNDLQALVIKYLTASIEIKYEGDHKDSLEILDISDKDAQITIPRYFTNQNYQGFKINSNTGQLNIKCRCRNDEKIIIELKGINYVIKKPNGRNYSRMPINIDYQKFFIDDEIIFENSTVVNYEKPYKHIKKINKNDVFNIKIDWLPVNKNSDYIIDKKLDTEIIINSPEDSTEKSKIISGKLIDENQNAVSNALIKLLVNNGRASILTDDDGQFKYEITNPKIGLNQVHVFYGGNASYLESSGVVSFEILPLDTRIMLDSVSDVKKGDAVELLGKLVDENDNPLLGADVKLQINNGRATVRTNDEGIFKYLFSNPKDGVNNISAVFNGSKNYRSDSDVISFMALALDTEIVLDRVESVKMGDAVEISGKLIDENRDAVSGAQIKLLINNGRSSLKTDEDGHFSYVVSNPRVGLNQVNVLFEGNTSYLKSNGVVSFETLPLDCKIHLDTVNNVKIGDAVEITGNLMDENQKIIPNAVVKLLINNGRATIRTDDDGYFSYVVNNPRIGLNYITASYNSKDFKEVSETISFEVLTLDTDIELDTINDAKKGEVVEISGKLLDEKQGIIPNAQLKLFINNGRVTIRTNDEGIFKYEYKTSRAGRNNVMIFFLGSKKHNPLNISSQFTVHDKKQ